MEFKTINIDKIKPAPYNPREITTEQLNKLVDSIKEHGYIVDPFVGGGTTLIAAEQLNRKARCIELNPKNVQETIKRFNKAYPNKTITCLNREVKI